MGYMPGDTLLYIVHRAIKEENCLALNETRPLPVKLAGLVLIYSAFKQLLDDV